MNIRENRGITLTTLVVTIIVLLILAGVATSTGIEAIENTKHTKFVAELKIMQSHVNQWYEDCKPSINSANYDETFNSNIQNKFTTINAKNATEDEQAQTTLNQANIPSENYSNFYLLEDEQKSALGVEGVTQKVLVSVKNRKVVSYDGLKYKNKMYYVIDDQSGEGIGEIFNVEYRNPHTNAPQIAVKGKSIYYGDTAKGAKYKFTVDVTQGSNLINKGELYYGKIENGNVKGWKRTEDTSIIVDREGTYRFYYKDAAGNISEQIDYVIEPKATLIDGPSFNVKMKTLAGVNNPTHTTDDTNIIKFRISDVKPGNSILVDNNKVSTANSQFPVYMWFDNGTIWIWSEENWFDMNSNSSNVFRQLKKIEQIESLYKLNSSKVTNMHAIFYEDNSLLNLDISNFNTQNVSAMSYMFYNCKSITSLDLSKFNTQNVTTMSAMFMYCTQLKKLDLSNFNTSKVTTMSAMFSVCKDLESLNVSSFNTSKVTEMNNMFYDCENITSLDVRNFNTSKVTTMSNMFQALKKIDSIDVSGFDTSKVTTMRAMFSECENLQVLNLENFKTSKVQSMWFMFNNCSNLTTIYTSDNFVTTALTNQQIDGYGSNHTTSTYLFLGCNNLKGGLGTTYSYSHTDADYAHIDGGPSNPGYFTKKE